MSNGKEKMMSKFFQTMFEVNMAATYVGLNEKGEVEARALTSEELLKLKDLYDNHDEIPKEYTIYTEKDIDNTNS